MKKIFLTSITAVCMLILTNVANSAILQITATSASSGELGWFAVDEAVLATDTTLQASQFVDYSFIDPNSSIFIDPSNVAGDTGFTLFGLINNIWTVTGGSGYSLTTPTSGLLLASTFVLQFNTGSSLSDVTWNTGQYTPSAVPIPAAAFMFAPALLGFMGLRRKAKNSVA